VGVLCTGAVGKTGVAAGVSQPASERSRLVAKSSQKSREKYFKRFILYSFIYIPILAFAPKKIPSQRERIRLVEWIGFGQGTHGLAARTGDWFLIFKKLAPIIVSKYRFGLYPFVVGGK
jgi:hypothetical protein